MSDLFGAQASKSYPNSPLAGGFLAQEGPRRVLPQSFFAPGGKPGKDPLQQLSPLPIVALHSATAR